MTDKQFSTFLVDRISENRKLREMALSEQCAGSNAASYAFLYGGSDMRDFSGEGDCRALLEI